MAKELKEIVLTIESIGFEGISIAREEGKVYFVKGGLPGDKVRAGILKNKKNYTDARLLEVLEPSPDRVEPKCEYFGSCGGCSWQSLKYEKQIEWKRKHIIDAFERLGKIEAKLYNETMPSPKQFEYRNKMEFSFGDSKWLTLEQIASEETIDRSFALGLHVPGRYDKIIDIDKCHIQSEIGNKIINIMRAKALEIGVLPYSSTKNDGLLKSIVIRYSLANNEIMTILVSRPASNDKDEKFIKWYAEDFANEIPEVNEVIHAVNNTRNTFASGDLTVYKGKGYITEKILGIDYRISPFSFFQTNSSSLDNFISLIVETAQIEKDQVVWDLYCGTGSITLPASKKGGKVIGIELVESSIKDAKSNAKLNGIENAEFYCEDLHSTNISEKLLKLPKPDTIIVDPPRAGMNPNMVNLILEFNPKRVVYVSCNPATQARDIALMQDKYYINTVTPVDMFPHTYHVESVAELIRKED